MTSISIAPRLIAPVSQSRKIRLTPLLQIALLELVVANLARIPVFTTGNGDRAVPLLVSDLIAILLIGLGAMSALLNRRLRIDSIAVVGLAFAALGGFTTIAGIDRFGLSLSEVVVALAFLARWLMYFMLYIVAANAMRAETILPVWQALEASVLLFAAFGIVQAAFLPNFAMMVYPDARAAIDWDIQEHRLVSTILDPNYAGAFIMIALLVQVGMVSFGARVARWKMFVLFAALLLTFSRSSILAFIIGALVIVAHRGLSKRLASFGGLLLLATLPALPVLLRSAAGYNKLGVDESALGRIVNWLRELTMIADHPIVGIGFNTWGAVQRRYGWETVAAAATFGAEGGLLFLTVLTGFIGLALYVGMMVLLYRRSRRISKDPMRLPHERGIAAALPALAVAMVVHSLFTNSLFHPLLMEPLWILWAMSLVIISSPPALAAAI